MDRSQKEIEWKRFLSAYCEAHPLQRSDRQQQTAAGIWRKNLHDQTKIDRYNANAVCVCVWCVCVCGVCVVIYFTNSPDYIKVQQHL